MLKRFSKEHMLAWSLLVVILVACGNDNSGGSNEGGQTSLRSFDWDHSADSILVRFDEIPGGETEAYVTNQIPPCTIWGNGRLVWVNFVVNETEILEARLSDNQIRDFVEDIIGYGFYSWEDDVIPPIAEHPTLQSIVLNLFANPKTVERYGGWPNNAFERLVEQCRGLSQDRALVIPTGGWLRAYPIEFDEATMSQEWPRNAPFRMADVSTRDTPCWVEGGWAAQLWSYTRTISLIQVTERGAAFEVSLQVPGLTRSSPPTPGEQQSRC